MRTYESRAQPSGAVRRHAGDAEDLAMWALYVAAQIGTSGTLVLP